MCSSHLGSRVIKASVSCMPSKGDYPTPLRFRRRSPAPESSGEHRQSPPYPAGNPELRYGLVPVSHVIRARGAHSVRSPPPCGEGSGVGVVRFSCRWHHRHLAASPPSPALPHKGGGSKPSLPLPLI